MRKFGCGFSSRLTVPLVIDGIPIRITAEEPEKVLQYNLSGFLRSDLSLRPIQPTPILLIGDANGTG